jgi:hypothetical protein
MVSATMAINLVAVFNVSLYQNLGGYHAYYKLAASSKLSSLSQNKKCNEITQLIFIYNMPGTCMQYI